MLSIIIVKRLKLFLAHLVALVPLEIHLVVCRYFSDFVDLD
jgi:hypothetical protein